MEIELLRYNTASKSTSGLLFINGDFACHTLEDKVREKKLAGETCIPPGRYSVNLRTEGNQHKKYRQKFPEMHKGMLHVQEVPGFNCIHIHIGNTINDTRGCILLGDTASNGTIAAGTLSYSTNAYKRVYPHIADAIEQGEEVWITIGSEFSGIPSQPVFAQVKAQKLNMRIAPNSDVVGTLNQNTRLRLLEKRNQWSKVQIDAWVANNYLDKAK